MYVFVCAHVHTLDIDSIPGELVKAEDNKLFDVVHHPIADMSEG